MSEQQKLQFKEHQQSINEAKQRFKSLIDKLILNKTQFMQELQALEATTDKLKDILTPDQTAKYLIFVEKVSHTYILPMIFSLLQLKSKSTLNIFNLWGLRKIGSAEKANNNGDSQSSKSSRFNHQQDESSYLDKNDFGDDGEMSGSHSLDGLPHSDNSSSDEDELTLTNNNPNHKMNEKKGRSSIDLKAAALAYYGGVSTPSPFNTKSL